MKITQTQNDEVTVIDPTSEMLAFLQSLPALRPRSGAATRRDPSADNRWVMNKMALRAWRATQS